MIPISDTVQRRNLAWMTWLLIGLNVWVFLVESLMDRGPLISLLQRFMLVPADPQVATLFGHMFLHGGLGHLIGNMWFLWLFGDNVEDRMGPFRFLVFYLLCGLLAAGLHVWTESGSYVPVLGASGAIAGVMGAFCLMFPRARLVVLGRSSKGDLPTFPALVYFLGWYAFQLYSGWQDEQKHSAGGLAWWSHIGGFLAGCVLFHMFVRADRWSRHDPGYKEVSDKPAQPRRWPVARTAPADQRYGPAPLPALDDVAPVRDRGEGLLSPGDVGESGDHS